MFDVFISYGHQDQLWVRTLAENLYREGLEVFYDEWNITAGDVLAHKLDDGILTSHSGILIVSPTSVTRSWVREEYAAMLTRAVAGQQRLIPVLLKDTDLPAFLASRVYVDFRNADGPEYERRVKELVAALRGDRPTLPPRGGPLAQPPEMGYRAEGSRRATLKISLNEVSFSDDKGTSSHQPKRLDASVQNRVWELAQARLHPVAALRDAPPAGFAGKTVQALIHERSLAVGSALTTTFFNGSAGEALSNAVTEITRLGGSLELALEIADELSTLPWETLRLPAGEQPGTPLALHPNMKLYRHVSGLGATPAMNISGPLRILVVIASPEAGDRRGELLDYEAELNRLLDAVDTPRREEKAYVRILNQGTIAAIHEALTLQRFHILHLSCHARPGVLVLEDEEGREQLVDATQFANEVLPPDRGVPLLVLSGCSTAVEESEGGAGEEALPGVARALLVRGVPSILAMTAPVTDPYATGLAAKLYAILSTEQHPDVLSAFSEARRTLELERTRSSDQRLIPLAEWATPTLFLRGQSLPLYARNEPFETLTLPPELQFSDNMVVRKIGDFVGRRTELHRARRVLRQNKGLVLHGIGGIGKSTLAAQSVSQLGDEAGLIIPVSGTTNSDTILDEIGKRLQRLCRQNALPTNHPFQQIAALMREPKVAWKERLEILAQEFADSVPILLLLDNFEDLLNNDTPRQVSEPELAAFLAAWVSTRARTCLLITSRYPFLLPKHAERHLTFIHLGPLSWAETRKLIWRLDGLNVLTPDEQQRAYLNVGGHPRTLEYLDAILCGGQARFTDITLRMEDILKAHNITPQLVWQHDTASLDIALAEAITLAVDDIVLRQLLERLDPIPLARSLLVATSVYRLPIDNIGLGWHIGEEQPLPDDPERDARITRMTEARRKAQVEGRSTALDQLGFSADEVAQIRQDLIERSKPPLRVPTEFEQAKAALLDLGLLAPSSNSEPPTYLVHRWTAQALANQQTTNQIKEAHRRAARYWHWRVDVWPQSRVEDIEQLLEARYHHYEAGDMNEALDVTGTVCGQLETWGAYRWERRLCQEALRWSPLHSQWEAAFTHQLGMLAQLQGDYSEARRQYLRALQLFEELGNRSGMATSYHQLGMLAQLQGDYSEARRQYLRALQLFEELGNRSGMANSYGQLGMLAQLQGDYSEARRQYLRALQLFEELGNRSGMATTHSQLGILLTETGEVREAIEYTLLALLFRIEASIPQARIDLRSLAHQRTVLGEEQFKALVSERLGEENAVALLQMLDQQEGEQ